MEADRLLRVIKQAAVDAVNASSPMGLVTGEIVNTSPLKIKVSQQITIEKDMILKTATFSRQSISVGDAVFLMAEQGGQRYLVIDKVG